MNAASPIVLSSSLADLVSRKIGGGMAGSPGDDVPRADALAWTILAFRGARDAEPDARERSSLTGQLRSDLQAFQLPDGRVPVTPEHATAYWPTTLAALAWMPSSEHREARDRALEFLVTRSGGLAMPNSPFVGHDSTLVGWSWIQATHSWVEPTAMALLTLRLTGSADHPRCAEARRLLLDRQLDSGGWNYGNTETFDQQMRPAPDSTGIALTGLVGTVTEQQVAKSLDYLLRAYARVRSPLAVAWSILGLSAWNRRPDDAELKVAETLERQEQLGAFDTSLLAQLVLAVTANRGLGEAVR